MEISKLGADGEVTYLLAPTLGSAAKVDVRIIWEDDSGEPRVWESELTL